MATILEAERSTDETPTMGWRRRLLAFGVVILAVLLVAELGTRLIERNLPEPLVWHSFEAQKKVQQMDALAKTGGADIVFMGTSMINTGLEPSVVSAKLGNGLVVYNAAISSAIPRLSEVWLKDVVLPRLHPKLLVLGLSSYELSDNPKGRDLFFNAFLDSAGGRQATNRDSALQDVNRWLGQHSALWDHRFELRDPKNVVNAIRGKRPVVDPDTAGIEPNGRSSYGQTQKWGDLPLAARVDVSHWAPGVKDPAAVERLIDNARVHGTRVALLDMPVTNEYVAEHPHGDADFQTYLHMLQDIGTRKGVPVVQMDQLRDHSLFGDVIHLNITGAPLFSAQVADWLVGSHLLDGISKSGR